MIAGLRVLARLPVDRAGGDLAAEGFAHQDVVDAQATVFLEAQHAVVPPRKALLGLVEHAVCIGETQLQEALEVGALFHGVVDGVFQAHGVEGVAVFRRHVEVAHEHQPGVGEQFFPDPSVQRVQPEHLVCELLRARGLAVHEVAVDEPERALGRVQRRCDHACLGVFVAGDVAHHVAHGRAAQDGDTVIGLLPEAHGVVAGGFEGIVGEFFVHQLEFLQANGIHGVVGQPGQHLGQPHGEGVDVPGGQLHGMRSMRGRTELAGGRLQRRR